MTLLLTRPEAPGGTLLLATFGAANPATFFSKKVKAWDPTKHPKGHKGLFVETPDKVKAKGVKPGDVITTKNGKSFKVEKPTAKGVKVNPLDPVTGEQKTGYTVLGHDVEVAVVETAKGPGTAHPIGDLEPGTIVKTKSGKRFKIAKHGKESVSKTGKVSKNTTVYPVDDKGEVTGKHTILPQDHVVTIDAPEVIAHPTTADLKKVDQAMESHKAESKPKPDAGSDDALAQALVDAGVIQDMDDAIDAVAYAKKASMELHHHEPQNSKEFLNSLPPEYDHVDGGQFEKVWQKWHQPSGPAPGETWKDQYGNEWKIVTANPDGTVNLKSAGGGMVHEGYKPDILISKTKDAPKKPSEYHKSPQGLAQLLVDHGLTETGEENAFSDVMDAIDKVGENGDDGVDGLPKTGADFATAFMPAQYGTAEWTAMANAYDEWHKPKATGADPVLIPPDPITAANILAEQVGGDPQDAHDWLASHYPDGLTSPAEMETAWHGILTDMQEAGLIPDDVDASPSPGYVSKLWKDNSTEVVDGAPSPLQAAMQALAKAESGMPSQAPVIAAMKNLDDWKDYEAFVATSAPVGHPDHVHDMAHALSMLQSTTAWTTVHAASGKLDELYQEQVAYNQAVAASQAAAPDPAEAPPEEILPQKLPKVPTPYPPGVGKDTRLEIRGMDGQYSLYRVSKDGHEEAMGDYTSKTQATKAARQYSADHEQILLDDAAVDYGAVHTAMGKADAFKPGDIVITTGGQMARVTSVVDEKVDLLSWQKDSGYPERVRRTVHTEQLHVDGVGSMYHYYKTMSFTGAGEPGGDLTTVSPSYNFTKISDEKAKQLVTEAIKKAGSGQAFSVGPKDAKQVLVDAGHVKHDESEVRKARPERYNQYLQQEWEPDELIGSSVNDGLKTLGKLGYREIKPRLKDRVRVVNANGARLTLDRQGSTITGVTKLDAPALHIEGSAADLYEQLSETLATGGDVTGLDPDSLPAVAATSHVRRMVYDMALGKQNKVAESIGKNSGNVKVKSDAEYVKEFEETGEAPTLGEALEIAERPPYTVSNPRSGSLEQFPGQTLTDTGAFTTEEDLDEWEAAALSAIMKRQGVAKIVGQKGEPTISEGDYVPGLKADDPIEGARKLAKAWEDYHGFVTAGEDENAANTLIGQLSPASQTYLTNEMTKWKPLADAARKARQDEWEQRAENYRAQYLKDLIDERRAEEGTVAEPPSAQSAFDLPVWDEIEWETQSFADINQLAAEIGTAPYDVPAFYTGGVLQDGLLYHRSDKSNGKVPLEFDSQVTERLKQLGAFQEANKDPIAPGVQGSYKHYEGQQLTLNDSGGPVALDKLTTAGDQQKLFNALAETVGVSGLKVEAQHAAVEAYDEGGIDAVAKWWAEKNWLSPDADQVEKYATALQKAGVGTKVAGAAKRIEYVFHAQAPGNAGGAPTSQRGVIRMVGYTPEEAAAKLKEIGLLGDLEPEVPFKALMRGPRRYGALAPMHPAYVRGEAPLPDVKYRITHGMTAAKGDAMGNLKAIVDSGGLMSIAERHRQGILLGSKGVSVSGDVRSGIDHALFCTTDGHGACGSAATVKFVFKPQAYLRRDITLAPYDFGGCETRYGQYKSYLNKLQGEVGVKKTNLYAPVDPKVRQRFIDTATGSSSEEFNVGPGVPLEDIEAIGVPDDQIATVNAWLDGLIAKGRIASKPKVISNSAASTLANQGVKGTGAPTKKGSDLKTGDKVKVNGIVYTVQGSALQAEGQEFQLYNPTMQYEVVA